MLEQHFGMNEYTYTTVGLHHEYYGNGYGIFSNIYNKQMANKQYNNIENILTYDPNDIDNLSALSYFPAKVLEIIDTYDVLYRDFSKDEIKGSIDNKILSFMYENFLDNKIKIDPIIFSIFIKYIENIKNISVVDCPL